MAKLSSIEKGVSIILNPLKYEYPGEEWVTSTLIFERNNKSFLSNSSAFLQANDYKLLIDELEKLLDGRINKVEINPIEPNFKLTLSILENGMYEVRAVYFKEITYKDGKEQNIVTKNNSLDIKANKQDCKKFLDQLKSELMLIKHN